MHRQHKSFMDHVKVRATIITQTFVINESPICPYPIVLIRIIPPSPSFKSETNTNNRLISSWALNRKRSRNYI